MRIWSKKGVVIVGLFLWVALTASGSVTLAEAAVRDTEAKISVLREKLIQFQQKQEQLVTSRAPAPQIDGLAIEIEKVKYDMRMLEGDMAGGTLRRKGLEAKKALEAKTKIQEEQANIQEKKSKIAKVEAELNDVNEQISLLLKKKGASKTEIAALEAKAKGLKEKITILKQE